MNPTVLYLFRHGHTVGGDELRYKGHIDVELSRMGREQVDALATELADRGIRFPVIYTSDLSRARQSAEIIARRIRAEVVVIPELRERHFGKWEGLSFQEIAEQFPEEFRRWKQDPLRAAPPDGETTLQVYERVTKIVNECINRHRGAEFCIVAHGGVNRLLICYFLGLPLENIFRIEQDYGCVNIIELYEDGWPVLKRLNYTGCDLSYRGGDVRD